MQCMQVQTRQERSSRSSVELHQIQGTTSGPAVSSTVSGHDRYAASFQFKRVLCYTGCRMDDSAQRGMLNLGAEKGVLRCCTER
jgi:hypothetical protein